MRQCLFLILLIALTACDSAPSEQDQSRCDGSFSARVDGVAFTANRCDAGPSLTLNNLSVGGSRVELTDRTYRTLHSVGFSIRPLPAPGTTGTFTTTGDCDGFVGGTICAGYHRDDAFQSGDFRVRAGTGMIRIQTYTRTRVSGTIEFEAFSRDGRSVRVTDGRFDIRIPE